MQSKELYSFIIQAICLAGVFMLVLTDNLEGDLALAFIAGVIIPSPITTAITVAESKKAG